jgi:AcrR family transcriptional regulator
VPRLGLSRAEVVEAAARIADAEGLDAVTVARVASQLGIKPPSLYNHVESREHLLRELSLRGLRELGAALTGAAVGRARDDALLATAAAHRRYALEHPGLYAATIRAAPDVHDRERVEAADAALGVILAVLAGYGLEGDDAIHAARALRSALHGFSSLESAGGFGMPTDRDESFERMVATLAAGMAARVS